MLPNYSRSKDIRSTFVIVNIKAIEIRLESKKAWITYFWKEIILNELENISWTRQACLKAGIVPPSWQVRFRTVPSWITIIIPVRSTESHAIMPRKRISYIDNSYVGFPVNRIC